MSGYFASLGRDPRGGYLRRRQRPPKGPDRGPHGERPRRPAHRQGRPCSPRPRGSASAATTVVDCDTLDPPYPPRCAHPERPLRCGPGAPGRADASTPPPRQRADIGWLYREWVGPGGRCPRARGRSHLAEESVQDAFAMPLERWPRDHLPHDPGAWIIRTARNRAIDRIRRRSMATERERQAVELEALRRAIEPERDSTIPDQRLRSTFAAATRRSRPTGERGADAAPRLTARGRSSTRVALHAAGDRSAARARQALAARGTSERRTPRTTSRPSAWARCSPSSTWCSTRAMPRPAGRAADARRVVFRGASGSHACSRA